MRILFLTTQLPFPPVSGGVIKSWRLIKHWSKHDLRVVCNLKRGEDEHVAEFHREVPQVKLFAIPFEKKRTPINFLKSYFKSPSLNAYRQYNPTVEAKVKEWLKEVDVVIVDHYEMGQFVPPDCGVPMVLHEHNAEYIMWKRLAELEKNPFKKALITLEADRIRRVEKCYADRAAVTLAAPNDIDELRKIGVDPNKMEKTYHLGEDYLLERDPVEFDETGNHLLYVGTLSWEANIDGLLWFLEKVFPELRKIHPDVEFKIVGKNPDKRLRELISKTPGAVSLGFIEDLEPLYQKARVFVVPLRFGSGIKVKLLNAMYRGIPVVTTPIGTEGLEVESGRQLYSSSNERDQVLCISELLSSKSQWEKMRDLSRETAKKYTWKSLLEDHDNILNRVVSQSKISASSNIKTS